MKPGTALGLSVLLAFAPLRAAPPSASPGVERIIQAVMPVSKQRELFDKAVDRMVENLAQKKSLPPGCADEMRAALRSFLSELVDDGVLARMATVQLREKLSEEEILTLATFLESSVGQKLVNKTITLGFDKERLNRDMKGILDAKKDDLVSVMTRIMEKYGVSTR